MNGCVFEKVYIIGNGQAVGSCILKLNELKSEYGYGLTYIDYNVTALSFGADICKRENIPYVEIAGKQELTDYFCGISETSLIVSAGNCYIFPESVVDKENLTIINFHSGILPKYRGRNAQSWAIFYEEEYGGATWHYVNNDIDAGKTLIEKRCPITDDTKAYELTGAIMDKACEGFAEIIDGVLTAGYDKLHNIPVDEESTIYKSTDVPGNSRFDISDDPKYIYRVLRACDYGKSDIFPPVKTDINGKDVRISSYKKIANEGLDSINIDERSIFIPMDSDFVLRLKYKDV